MDPEELEENKVKVVELLQLLQTRVDICVETGMLDTDSKLYNYTYDLIDDTKEIESPDELQEIINKGRTIETNLDRWLTSKGQTTMSLSWPKLTEEPLE